MKILTCICLSILFFIAPAFVLAQSTSLPEAGRAEFAIRGLVGFPSFSNKTELGIGLGAGANVGYKFVHQSNTVIPHHISAGLNFDYLWFGGTSNSIDIYDIHINSNGYGFAPYLLASAELLPKVSLFAMGMAGFFYYNGKYTATWIPNVNGAGNQSTETFTETFQADFSFFNGIGGGIKVSKLEIRFMANFGQMINMVDANTIKLDATGKISSYGTKRVSTDKFIIGLGIRL
ncbi:MAG: hypothetical protein ACK4Y6_05505 [Bacteroidota bacterium]|jgi:hypothetical protein